MHAVQAFPGADGRKLTGLHWEYTILTTLSRSYYAQKRRQRYVPVADLNMILSSRQPAFVHTTLVLKNCCILVRR